MFHDCLHMTPVEYITTYRLQVACQMLAKGQEAVTVISHECGLGSISYFERFFGNMHIVHLQNIEKNGRIVIGNGGKKIFFLCLFCIIMIPVK